MITKIGHGGRRHHLYIQEWMAAKGVTFEDIGNRLDPPKSRTTVWRWVTEQHRLNPEKIAALADALGIAAPQLWSPPPPSPRESLDALTADASDELHSTVIDIVRRLIRRVP